MTAYVLGSGAKNLKCRRLAVGVDGAKRWQVLLALVGVHRDQQVVIYANNVHFMKATFVELPPFERLRADYLDDAAYRQLQLALMANPEAGDVIEGTERKEKRHEKKA